MELRTFIRQVIKIDPMVSKLPIDVRNYLKFLTFVHYFIKFLLWFFIFSYILIL